LTEPLLLLRGVGDEPDAVAVCLFELLDVAAAEDDLRERMERDGAEVALADDVGPVLDVAALERPVRRRDIDVTTWRKK